MACELHDHRVMEPRYIAPADLLARGPAIWTEHDRKLDAAREARRIRRAELHDMAAA